MIVAFATIVFGSIAKAMLTGIGLALGFSIVYGFPRVMDEVAQGIPFFQAIKPAWLQNLHVNPYRSEEEELEEQEV
jgi:hypothetical protein